MKLWFWFDTQNQLGPKWGFLRGISEPGHLWLWLCRINCGVILYNSIQPAGKVEVIRHNVRCFLARRYGAKTVLTVPGYLGTPIRLSRWHCDQLRKGIR